MFANLCKPFGDVIIIRVYDGFFKPEKVGEERAELRNFEYLENENSF